MLAVPPGGLPLPARGNRVIPMLPALAVLFTRLDASAIDCSPSRRALLRLLQGAPGLRASEAARALDVDYKTAQHHLRHLERAGRVVSARVGRGIRFYLPGTPRPPQPARRLAALRAVREGATSAQHLARVLGLPRGTAGGLLGGLRRRGLVDVMDGRARLTAEGERALAVAPPDEAFC